MLEIKRLNKSFGAVQATNDVSLTIADGGIHAIIGPNGAGKTSLINQIYGSITPDSGTIICAGEDITRLPAHKRVALGIARSFQRSTLLMDFTVFETVMAARIAQSGGFLNWWASAFADKTVQGAAESLLARVGLSHRADAVSGTLAHGEKRLLELALALAGTPKLLLLDEPMAGTGVGEAQRLAQIIKSIDCTIVLVEHDMDAVFRLADRITVMVEGAVLATDTPQAIAANPLVREAYLGQKA